MVYLNTLETKHQSMCWNDDSDKVSEEFTCERLTKKVMLTIFWDCRGIILKGFLEGGRANAVIYQETLHKL